VHLEIHIAGKWQKEGQENEEGTRNRGGGGWGDMAPRRGQSRPKENFRGSEDSEGLGQKIQKVNYFYPTIQALCFNKYWSIQWIRA
jgi:hypothetical protein